MLPNRYPLYYLGTNGVGLTMDDRLRFAIKPWSRTRMNENCHAPTPGTRSIRKNLRYTLGMSVFL
jgi:hypothetical protein